MASTYTLLSSTTVASDTTSVTFSSIPQTYTDLLLRVSVRVDPYGPYSSVSVNYNGSTSSYSYTSLVNSLGTYTSSGNSGVTKAVISYADGGAATANTFSSGEIYIPNYTSSAVKPASGVFVTENNTNTLQQIGNVATLWSDTPAAITTIAFTCDGANFLAKSSFHLYGIKNS